MNYYIDEDPDNYQVIRSDVDVYKFTLNKTEVVSIVLSFSFKLSMFRLIFMIRCQRTLISGLMRRE